MKILQINSVCDFGSTGRTTRELADYLEQQGHECYIAYGHGTTTFHNSFKIGGKLENHFHNAFYTRILGLHGYGTQCGTHKLIKWIDEIEPDIIHLRNLHANYLNFPILFEFIIERQIPVVFTLHDCFNFTGKCAHYTAIKCYKWKTECKHCPTFRDCVVPSLFFDNSRMLFLKKKRYYGKMKHLNVVAVSKWLAEEAKQSAMLATAENIQYIYNWIDYKKFHRANISEIEAFYEKYKLSREYKYIISVSQGWDNKASRYKDALRLAKKLPSNYRLILVGSVARGSIIEAPLVHIPYINGCGELSVAYSMAEAYIHLSVEDTFGKVIAEAMSCGTVPITFNSTACGEIPGPYGLVVAPHDIDAVIESLPHLSKLQEQSNDMIRYVLDNYDYHTNAQLYLDLYKKILRSK
ncbi:MAG: glycosyltransferase [Bacteroidaceae bacterium]|nr:glycosyltransferase [Bacteroidaceae bacterium]